MYKIKGHHHISMVTKNANENNHFYKNVLGLRRVKMTVNKMIHQCITYFMEIKQEVQVQNYRFLKFL